MQLDQHKQTIDNLTNYLNEVFADRVDRIMQKFIELVGSDKPSHWKKEGYDVLDYYVPKEKLGANELQKRVLILRRGKKRFITGVSVVTQYTTKEKLETVTKPLTAVQLQNELNTYNK